MCWGLDQKLKYCEKRGLDKKAYYARKGFGAGGGRGRDMSTCQDLYGFIPNTVLSRTVVPDLGIFFTFRNSATTFSLKSSHLDYISLHIYIFFNQKNTWIGACHVYLDKINFSILELL